MEIGKGPPTFKLIAVFSGENGESEKEFPAANFLNTFIRKIKCLKKNPTRLISLPLSQAVFLLYKA